MSEWFWRKLNQYASWLAFIVLFCLLAVASNVEIKDLDLWLHLGAGQYILTHHQIPGVDIFSCTLFNHPWINHEWLFQVLVAWVHAWAGFNGLITLQTMLVFLTAILLLYFGYDRHRNLGTLLMLFLVFTVYEIRFTHRPDTFSLFFLVLYFWVLSFRLDRKISFFMVFIIQVLWTNMHGFFIFGPLLILIAMLGEWVKRLVALPFEWNHVGRLSDAEFRNLKIIFGISLAACLFNPYFIDGALYPMGVLTSVSSDSRIFFDYINELRKPLSLENLFSPYNQLSFKLLILISALGFVFNYRKIDLGVLALWMAFLVFSLSAVRNIVFFAFVAYLVFLINAKGMEGRNLIPLKIIKPGFKYALVIGLKVILIVFLNNKISAMTLRGYYDFDTFERKSEFGDVSLRNYPYQAVDFLNSQGIGGNFFNDFNSGAYLIGRSFPNVRVFIDGRTEVYGPEFFKRYRDIMKGNYALFSEAAREYQLTAVFLSYIYLPVHKQLIKGLYEDPQWAMVYFDYDAVIFLKNIEPNQPWIEKYRINLADWHIADDQLMKIGVQRVTPYRNVSRAEVLINLELYDKALKELQAAVQIQPDYDKAYKLLGRVYLETQDYPQAFANLRKAKLLNPQDLETRYYLSMSYLGLGEIQPALEQCQLILQKSPKNIKALYLWSRLLIAQKKVEEAWIIFEKAYQVDAQDTLDLEGLVDVASDFAQADERSKAKDIYGRVLKQDPEHAQAKEALENLN